MNAKFFSSVLTLLILLVSATFASAQNVLLFTFDDSGPNVTATVTGSFDTSGLSDAEQSEPISPGMFPFHSSTGFYWGTTTATNVSVFSGATAIAPGPGVNFAHLFNFFPGAVENPLSEYLEINASNNEGWSHIALAEGETIFDADTLENNVIVFQQGPVDLVGFGLIEPFALDDTFLSTTPITVLTDPSGENTIQFVRTTSQVTLGDINQDNAVNFQDISPFIEYLTTGGFLDEADCNQDGEVNFSDIGVFVAILSGGQN